MLAPLERAAAAAVAAGALPLGAPWIQWGRTASAARPGAGQLRAARGTAIIEAAVSLAFVTDWQPWRLKCCSHGKDAEREVTVAAQPCSCPAHTCLGLAQPLLVAGEPLASLWCFAVSYWDCSITRDSKWRFRLSWVKLALKNTSLFLQRANLAFLLLVFFEVMLSSSFCN